MGCRTRLNNSGNSKLRNVGKLIISWVAGQGLILTGIQSSEMLENCRVSDPH
jgi:hypothetical protein